MELRPLGRSDVKVSPVTFGAWAIGGWMWGGSEEADSIAAIHAAVDAGITSIDTAAIYGQGYSEELVGKAIKGRRDKVQVLTKCGMRWDDARGSEPWATKNNAGEPITVTRNSKPDSIEVECDRSLTRLGIDVIDLYQIHWPDLTTPVEDSIEAMEKLRKAGKIRAIGVSNYNGVQLAAADGWLKSHGSTLASLQPPYSVINRGIEKEVLPLCREHGIGTVVYSPMERGLLTGKYGPDHKFPEGDHRANYKAFKPEVRKAVQNALARVKPIADQHKATFAQLIVNWTFNEPGVTAALVGARNAEQAKQNAGAMAFTLTADERQTIRTAFDAAAKLMG
ncbi:MAG: aldo/keto reductase [Phycisphaerales bacterium]|nr:aldo/keto reductase [Phycisphaerales bacterium]